MTKFNHHLGLYKFTDEEGWAFIKADFKMFSYFSGDESDLIALYFGPSQPPLSGKLELPLDFHNTANDDLKIVLPKELLV